MSDGKFIPALVDLWLKSLGVPEAKPRAPRRGRRPLGPDGLTDLQRAFAVCRVFARSGTEAARLAGYADGGRGSSAIRVRAHELQRKPAVGAEIERQRGLACEKILTAVERDGIQRVHPRALALLADWRRCPSRWRFKILDHLIEAGFVGNKVTKGHKAAAVQ